MSKKKKIKVTQDFNMDIEDQIALADKFYEFFSANNKNNDDNDDFMDAFDRNDYERQLDKEISSVVSNNIRMPKKKHDDIFKRPEVFSKNGFVEDTENLHSNNDVEEDVKVPTMSYNDYSNNQSVVSNQIEEEKDAVEEEPVQQRAQPRMEYTKARRMRQKVERPKTSPVRTFNIKFDDDAITVSDGLSSDKSTIGQLTNFDYDQAKASSLQDLDEFIATAEVAILASTTPSAIYTFDEFFNTNDNYTYHFMSVKDSKYSDKYQFVAVGDEDQNGYVLAYKLGSQTFEMLESKLQNMNLDSNKYIISLDYYRTMVHNPLYQDYDRIEELYNNPEINKKNEFHQDFLEDLEHFGSNIVPDAYVNMDLDGVYIIEASDIAYDNGMGFLSVVDDSDVDTRGESDVDVNDDEENDDEDVDEEEDDDGEGFLDIDDLNNALNQGVQQNPNVRIVPKPVPQVEKPVPQPTPQLQAQVDEKDDDEDKWIIQTVK